MNDCIRLPLKTENHFTLDHLQIPGILKNENLVTVKLFDYFQRNCFGGFIQLGECFLCYTEVFFNVSVSAAVCLASKESLTTALSGLPRKSANI